MNGARFLVLALCSLALEACVAKAVVSAVTLPVRAVGAGVDAVTTSQSEADAKRGREIRKREGQLGALDRAYAKEARRCGDGDRAACERAAALSQDIELLTHGEPLPD